MVQFKAFSPKVEVNGETVLSIVEGMGNFKDKAFSILEHNGIVEPKAGNWYSQQSWLDSFKEISEKLGRGTLFSIGQKIPENAKFPPTIDSLEKALSGIDVAYKMNHRGGDIGYYKYVGFVSSKEVKMICENPYPCDFDMGIIDAMAKKFKPEHVISISVKHINGHCRKNGDNYCEYLVYWL